MTGNEKDFYVYVEQDEEGFFVGEVPQLRGAHSRSLEELMKNVSEVFQMCLEDMEEVGPLPELIGIQKVVLDDAPAQPRS